MKQIRRVRNSKDSTTRVAACYEWKRTIDANGNRTAVRVRQITPTPQEIDKTTVKRMLESLGVEVFAVHINWSDSGIVRAVVPAGTPVIASEVGRSKILSSAYPEQVGAAVLNFDRGEL